MSGTMWDRIAAAYNSVKGGDALKVDGPGFKVYRTTGVIRIDIEDGADLEVHDPPKRS